MPIPQEVVDSVSSTNFKVLGDQPAAQAIQAGHLANQALANSVSFQQGMNTIFAAMIAKAGETLVTVDPTEGVATQALAQTLTKGAQTVPPVTAPEPKAG